LETVDPYSDDFYFLQVLHYTKICYDLTNFDSKSDILFQVHTNQN